MPRARNHGHHAVPGGKVEFFSRGQYYRRPSFRAA
jgi:hypothetical protein